MGKEASWCGIGARCVRVAHVSRSRQLVTLSWSVARWTQLPPQSLSVVMSGERFWLGRRKGPSIICNLADKRRRASAAQPKVGPGRSRSRLPLRFLTHQFAVSMHIPGPPGYLSFNISKLYAHLSETNSYTGGRLVTMRNERCTINLYRCGIGIRYRGIRYRRPEYMPGASQTYAVAASGEPSNGSSACDSVLVGEPAS
jgi:hypothetical protein